MRALVLMLTTLFGLMSVIAQADDWILVDKTAKGNTFYIRAGSVQEIGDSRRAWVMTDYGSPLEGGDHSSVALQEFDCKGKRTRFLQLTVFSKPRAQDARESFTEPGEWNYIIPDSVMESLMILVCDVKPSS
jgi:hypothetical protein